MMIMRTLVMIMRTLVMIIRTLVMTMRTIVERYVSNVFYSEQIVRVFYSQSDKILAGRILSKIIYFRFSELCISRKTRRFLDARCAQIS